MPEDSAAIFELLSLIEKHGLVPDEAKGEHGGWSLEHRMIPALVRQSPAFPRDWREVAATLRIDLEDVPNDVTWSEPPTGEPATFDFNDASKDLPQ